MKDRGGYRQGVADTIRRVETVVHTFERLHKKITPKLMLKELDRLEGEMK